MQSPTRTPLRSAILIQWTPNHCLHVHIPANNERGGAIQKQAKPAAQGNSPSGFGRTISTSPGPKKNLGVKAPEALLLVLSDAVTTASTLPAEILCPLWHCTSAEPGPQRIWFRTGRSEFL